MEAYLSLQKLITPGYFQAQHLQTLEATTPETNMECPSRRTHGDRSPSSDISHFIGLREQGEENS
jgi:hypothetical protein